MRLSYTAIIFCMLVMPRTMQAQVFTDTLITELCDMNQFPYPILTVPNVPPAGGPVSISFEWMTHAPTGGTGYLQIHDHINGVTSLGGPQFTMISGGLYECVWHTRTYTNTAAEHNNNRSGNGGNLMYEFHANTGAGGFGCLWPGSPCIRNFTITYPVQWAFVGSNNHTGICPGEAVSFTDESQQAPTSWQWSFPGGIPSSSAVEDPIVVYTTPGSYDVTLISSNGTVTDTIVMPDYVTVQAVGPLVVSPDTAICAGGAVGLYCQGSNAVWTPAAGLNDPFISFPTASPTTTTTYTVEAVALGGCQTSGQVTVTVVPYPVVQVNADDSVLCLGDTAVITASGASDFTWSPSTGLNTTNGNPVLASPSSPITYTVTGTDGPGCSDAGTISISFHTPPPTPTITDLGSELMSSIAVGYQWNYGGAPITGATAQNWVPQQNGAYTVTITDANGCHATSAPVVVLNVGVQESSADNVSVRFDAVTSSAVISGLGIQRVRVFASEGKLIHSEGPASSALRIALPGSGVYLVEVAAAEGVKAHRLVVP